MPPGVGFAAANHSGRSELKKLIATVAALLVSGAGFAQIVPAAKDTAKATVETAKQAKENVQGAVDDQPGKAIHKTKAKVHKAKAKSDATAAKEEAKNIVK
jgi:hypothetical protein